jgi:N,N'-diacetyllegionaminate synthase
MRIGGFSTGEKVLVVAEIGNNHEGKFEVARELVLRAADCGVDAVKFQTFQTALFVSASDPARFNRLKSFELTYDEFASLRELAISLGLLFISTPLDLESAKFLESQVDAFKVASSDNNFYPLLRFIAQTAKPVIISAGLTSLEEIVATRRYMQSLWESSGVEQQLAVLHCVTCYPALPEQINLSVLPRLRRELGCTVGYSDHTHGTGACLAAVALGAEIIEKHFTLDKNFSDFRDHQLSADPAEMKQLVEGIKRVRLLLGVPEKRVQPCETELLPLVRRSIVAAREMPEGHTLELSDLMWTRPGAGLAPGREAELLGRRLNRPLSLGETILLSDLEQQ